MSKRKRSAAIEGRNLSGDELDLLIKNSLEGDQSSGTIDPERERFFNRTGPLNPCGHKGEPTDYAVLNAKMDEVEANIRRHSIN